MTRAFVTGATGMIGSYLVERLVAAGMIVRVFVRPTSYVRHLQPFPVEIICGLAEDVETLSKSLKGCNFVYHLAGLVRPMDIFSRGNDFSQLQRINVDFTETMLETSLYAGVERFFYISSTSVYGLEAQVPISETTPLNPSSDYGLSKVLAEERVQRYQQKGLATTVIRPSIVYGPRDRHLAPLALSLVQLPIVPMIDNGKSKQDLVYVEDVVELIWLASQKEISVNKVYNAASGMPLTLREMLTSLRALTRKQDLSFPISSQIVQYIAPIVKWYLKRYTPGLEAIITPVGLAYLSRDVYYDISLAKRELSYAPKVDFKQGVKTIIAHSY